VKVYQVLLIYQYLSLLGCYQVLLQQQSQEAYQVLEFLEMFLTHDPTQPTKKLKISTQLNPAQRNPTQPVGRPIPWTTLCQQSRRREYDRDTMSELQTVLHVTLAFLHHNSEIEIEQGLTSHQTHYRSYRGRVFTGQMTKPTVSKQRRKTQD